MDAGLVADLVVAGLADLGSASGMAQIARYNDEAVVCVGVPFGQTRPQWILPYGGIVHLDGSTRTITADYR